MTQIISYLTFAGNCREAMGFYRDCLGGQLQLQTIGDSPMANQMPPEMKDLILHAHLADGQLELMGSDMVGENGLQRGNAVSLMLHCASEEQVRACYSSLAAGGRATHPLENTFWGALFGGLTDKYGNHWLLNFDKNYSRPI
ncbi:MAG: VOC family protein [Saprospiraceae bacterium]